MEYEDIVYEKADGVATITINRPKVYNAFRAHTVVELIDAFQDAGWDKEIGVIVLTGAGGNFSGGGDLQVETVPMEDQNDEWKDYGVKGEYGEMMVWFANDYFHIVAQRMCRKSEALPQVTIAAVDGIAVAIGLGLAVSSDLRLCSDRVRFAAIAVPAGFRGEWSAPRSLPGLIGQTKANEMILTGRFVEAEEADRIGLVNKVVPADKLMETAMAWATQLAETAPLALQSIKEVLRAIEGDTIQNAFQTMRTADLPAYRKLLASADAEEGVSAFVEKRDAKFEGR